MLLIELHETLDGEEVLQVEHAGHVEQSAQVLDAVAQQELECERAEVLLVEWRQCATAALSILCY